MATTEEQVIDQTNEILSLLRQKAGGTIFSVGFIKRTNGEFRHMICRLGVHSKLSGSGGDRSYDPISRGLITVYDIAKQAYRTIPVDQIVWIKVRGELIVTKGQIITEG